MHPLRRNFTRRLLIPLTALCLVTYQAHGQTPSTAKVYIYNAYQSYQLELTSPATLPIGSRGKVGYTLIETDLDSLGFKDPTGQTVYLLMEPGKTYYYGYANQDGAYTDMSPNAFWLSVATLSKYHRHYSITRKKGVVQLD